MPLLSSPKHGASRNRLPLLALILLLLVSCAPDTGPAMDNTAPPRFGGWITYWDFAAGLRTVTANPGAFSDIYFFAAVLTPEGRPVLYDPGLPVDAAVSRLKARNIRVWLTVVNDIVPTGPKGAVLKDPDAIHAMLSSPGRRQAHIRDLCRLAGSHGFQGLDIDYENLNYADRDAFSHFIAELKTALAARGLALSVTVQPKTADRKGQGPGAMDWSALCSDSDQLQIMLYNLHSSKTGPGPLATLDWLRDVMTFAAGRCSTDKLVPVLKTSGMQWNSTTARDLNHRQIRELAALFAPGIERDPDGTPYLTYKRDRQRNTVYFEDRSSLQRKTETLRQLGFRRISLWRIAPDGFIP